MLDMHQTVCACNETTCAGDVGYFYTSIQYNGQSRLCLGPFFTHEDALNALPLTHALCDAADARACWYAYGTAHADTVLPTLFDPCPACGEILGPGAPRHAH